MKAYNINILKKSATEQNRLDGWMFGLPPGIIPEQWPLDPNTGYPLQHGFTIKLPKEHRIHGDKLVAISFFAIAIDHNDGGPEYIDGLCEALLSEKQSEDELFRSFWDAFQKKHPTCQHTHDILDCYYATILLTEEEFNGEFCDPPELSKMTFYRQAG